MLDCLAVELMLLHSRKVRHRTIPYLYAWRYRNTDLELERKRERKSERVGGV